MALNKLDCKLLKDNLNEIIAIINNIETQEYLSAVAKEVLMRKIEDLYSDVMLSEVSFKKEEESKVISNEDLDYVVVPKKYSIPKVSFDILEEKELQIESDSNSEDQEIFELLDESDSATDTVPIPDSDPIEIISQNLKKEPIENQTQQSLFPELVETKSDMPEPKSEKKLFFDEASATVNLQPLKDVASAIGINDRFLFTRELFSSNPKKFQQTIQVVNQSGSYEAAVEYLNDNFDWDETNSVVQLFMTLVRRRYL